MEGKKNYIPLQVRFEKKELDWLRKFAFKRKISIAALIREIVKSTLLRIK